MSYVSMKHVDNEYEVRTMRHVTSKMYKPHHRALKFLNCFCTSPMSLLFHSPTHSPLRLPVTHTLEEHLGGGVIMADAELVCSVGDEVVDDGAKIISGGMFSPNVRVSFAMRLRRISASDGSRGPSEMVGDIGITPMDDNGTRVSSGETGTVLMRRTSGRGPSAERRPFEGVVTGHASRLGRVSCASERREEFADEAEYMLSFDETSSAATSGNTVKIDAWRRAAFVFELVL